MTTAERKAAAWAVKLLDGMLALTGTDIKPESRAHYDELRRMAGIPAEPIDYGSHFAARRRA